MTASPGNLHAALSQSLDPRSLASIRALETKKTPDFLALLIGIFLEDTNTTVNELGNAVKTGNTHAIHHLSHRLKGSCASFGAHALVATCEELEGLGSIGSLHGAAESLERLETEYMRVRSALEQVRSDSESVC